MAIPLARAGVDQHDIAGLKAVVDARKGGLHLGRGDDMAIGHVAEIQLYPRANAPVQRDLVDGDGALAAVHRGVIVPGRIQMRAVVRGHLQPFRGRPGAITLLFGGDAEHRLHLGRACGMVKIVDCGHQRRWVCRHIVFDRDREINDPAGHGLPHLWRKAFSL